jgi:fermentation-respiration switch protein FrsA (DUF1100 family)
MSRTAGLTRRAPAALLAAACMACSAPSNSAVVTPSVTPITATEQALLPYYGSYTGGGDLWIVTRLGWFFDRRDNAYRTLYSGSAPNRFTIGNSFLVPLPKYADIVFTASSMTMTAGGRAMTGTRVSYRQSDVTIHANGADLAATVTEALSPGPHAGIVVVHGSESGERHFYDFWVGLYASLGVDVLTYDKRGRGESTGRYPGEFPTPDALRVYADDASAALALLASYPGVDARRVGFHGGSQGGWTVPLAIQLHGGAAFAILVSAPAVTVNQQGAWADFSDGGSHPPTATAAEMKAAVLAANSGYDPAPALAALSMPTLWLLGDHDLTVPTAICVDILNGLNNPKLLIRRLPTGHAMLVNLTGLAADDAKSPGLAPELVTQITDWLQGI